jgi:hypothetical protein
VDVRVVTNGRVVWATDSVALYKIPIMDRIFLAPFVPCLVKIFHAKLGLPFNPDKTGLAFTRRGKLPGFFEPRLLG